MGEPHDTACVGEQDEHERVRQWLVVQEILSVLAHDLSQPLMAIVTNANAARRWLALDPANVHEASAAAQRIVGEGARASQLLDGVRSQIKRHESRPDPTSLVETLPALAALLHVPARRADVTLELQLPTSLPSVHSDTTSLRQIVVHLATNALEAMHDAERRTLVVSAAKHDAHVVVSLRDSGHGLPADRDQAFRPFFSTKPQHLGLGLNVCRTLLHSLGGQLWAAPNEGGGETFHFSLPITR